MASIVLYSPPADQSDVDTARAANPNKQVLLVRQDGACKVHPPVGGGEPYETLACCAWQARYEQT